MEIVHQIGKIKNQSKTTIIKFLNQKFAKDVYYTEIIIKSFLGLSSADVFIKKS